MGKGSRNRLEGEALRKYRESLLWAKYMCECGHEFRVVDANVHFGQPDMDACPKCDSEELEEIE